MTELTTDVVALRDRERCRRLEAWRSKRQQWAGQLERLINRVARGDARARDRVFERGAAVDEADAMIRYYEGQEELTPVLELKMILEAHHKAHWCKRCRKRTDNGCADCHARRGAAA